MKMSKAPDLLAIPYGTPTVRAHVVAQLARQDFAELDAPGAPVAVVDPAAGGPLRMSGLLHPFTRPPVAQDLAHGVDDGDHAVVGDGVDYGRSISFCFDQATFAQNPQMA